jgi:hypothetical protein
VLARYGPPALVALILTATSAAFVVTEHLKLEPTPITRTQVTKLFSPVCRCSTSKAQISFRLRKSDRVTITVVRPNGDQVARLLDGVAKPAGYMKVLWDGRDRTGAVARDGSYRVRVHLADARRTIELPNVIRLDATPPRIEIVRAAPRTISPDGDGRSDTLHITYKLNERARRYLYADGKLVGESKSSRPTTINWHGKIDGRVRSGWHRLTMAARDLAGNVSSATEPVAVRVRFLLLRPTSIAVKAGERFQVAVSTDRKLVRWRFAGASGRARERVLILKAPTAPGHYWLIVRSGPYAAGAHVIVGS